MEEKIILEGDKFLVVLKRLSYQIIEDEDDLSGLVIIGIQPRGIEVAKKIHSILKQETGALKIPFGMLDPTLFRDDLNTNNMLQVNRSSLDIDIENKRIILIDDVLYTGRTVRAAMESLLSYGRPGKIKFLCLVERRFARDLPIKSDYTGLKVDTIASQKVKVRINETQNIVSLT
ncbi:MAG: bifunctional pyr operon transcriptional regulator/uracil phosphoribosyltransferase PyrR [Solitalea-like symbiont of Acarus siro]